MTIRPSLIVASLAWLACGAPGDETRDAGGGDRDAGRGERDSSTPSDPDGGSATPDAFVAPPRDCEPNRWVTEDAEGGGDGSEGSPWTLHEAMASAQAGDTVRVGPGIYVGTATGDRYAPAFHPARSGTADAPIVFCAQYPAVHHETNRSELRHDGTVVDYGSPTFGTYVRSHIVWDGFYVNEQYALSRGDTGPVVVAESDHVTISRCVVQGLPGTRDDNHVGVRVDYSLYSNIVDNRIFDFGEPVMASRNHAGIMTYDSRYIVIDHNEIYRAGTGMYLKGDHRPDDYPNGAYTVRFNHVHDVYSHGITVLGIVAVDGQPSVLAQNLVERTSTCVLFNQVSDAEPELVDIVDNTFANCGAAFFHNARTSLWDIEVSRNLVFNGVVFNFEDWSEEQLQLVLEHGYRSDDNHAYGHSEWAFRMDLDAWRELSGLDGESSTGDPGFVDAEGGDFRLREDSIARTASIAGGPVGCYQSGDEIIGVRPPGSE